MIGDYMGAMRELVQSSDSRPTVENVARCHSSYVRWDRELKNNLRRGKTVAYSQDKLWETQYRPFVKQICYVEYILVNNKYRQDSIFPYADSENRAICIPGVGSTKPFSALAVDTMPDLALISKGQCFPRYRYERPSGQQNLSGMGPPPERIDNIFDTTLRAFRVHYGDSGITKDAIFDYVYGVLHAPDYRERFANDLAEESLRIPLADDFHAFGEAGRRLAELHLGNETCPEHPLEVEFLLTGGPTPGHFRIGARAMRFEDDERTVLSVEEHLGLRSIPPQAHEYRVNGRTPLAWLIDRYRIVRDTQSGIINDPNDWFDDPRDPIAALRHIVHVSVETAAIVARLTSPFSEPEEQPREARR